MRADGPAPVARSARSGPVASDRPHLRSDFVHRSALIQTLLESSDRRLVLIVAPPGYGKSTVLADWAECDPRPFVWAEPAALAEQTAIAARQHDRFVLVVDDAHVMAPGVLAGGVEAAMGMLPEGASLALAARHELPLRVGRMRAHRQLAELRTPQLAMSPTEASELLERVGLHPDPTTVQTLVERTEGWPVALYMATLTLDVDAPELAGFGGHHHVVADYLRDEVLATLPEDLLSFAIRSSVLDELHGPVCDAALRSHDSAALIERLAAATSLMFPIDSAHHKYRWHGVMRELLLAELGRLEPEREPTLRRRASTWYARRGDARRAADQAAAAGDARRTGELLWPDILSYLTHGHNDLVRDWLARFHDGQIAAHAPLAMSASFSALAEGAADDAQHWSLAAAAALERSDGDGPPSLSTGLALVGAISGHDGAVRMGELALEAGRREPEDSPWRPFCALIRGVALYLHGDRDGADLVCQDAVRLSGNDTPALASLGLAQRGMIALERKDWELAGELTDRAAMIGEEWDLTDAPLSAFVFAAAAASRAHEGRMDEAKLDLRRGIDRLTALGDFVPWYAAETRILLAHASLWLADVIGARTLLAEASRFARRTSGAPVFSDWFEQAWSYMDTLAEMSLSGPSSLTIAELRILRFLPSHRSFREIAEQLGVSANTVKTQAHAVYRKLGAASRSEAVAQAMNAGLLGQ